MILFTILAIAIVLAAIIAVVAAGIFGGAALMIFGDLIVFGLIMWGIYKLFFRKHK